MKFLKLLTRLIFISSLALPLLLISCGGGGGGGDGGGDGGSPSYTQEDLEGIWAVDNALLNSSTYDLYDRYHFINETGELINVETVLSETIYDFSGNFVVGSVTGNSWLDHRHSETAERHISDIYYDGQFVNINEIEADWDVPNALNGISYWYRVPYAGITEHALIDSDNALILAQGFITSVRPVGYLKVYFLTGTVANVDYTKVGSCGGTAQRKGTIDLLSGEFNGILQYNNFCDDEETDGFTVNGNADFNGLTDLASKTPLHYIYDYTNLTFVLEDESFSYIGRRGRKKTISPPVSYYSYVKTDENTGITYWIKDYFVPIIDGPDYEEIMTIFGRFYDSDYGYVELSIDETIRTDDSDEWASSGKLVLTGAAGTQGGNTKIRINYLSATQYMVEADTDGDGAYDNYNSGSLLFSELP